MDRQCDTCFNEEAHHHIIVENGKVTEVWYLSADGYWDRDLLKVYRLITFEKQFFGYF